MAKTGYYGNTLIRGMFRIALGTQHVLNEYLLYELMRKRIAMPELLKYV